MRQIVRWCGWLLVAVATMALASSFDEQRLYQVMAQTYGNAAKERAKRWRGLITEIESAGYNEQRRLQYVNNFFNQLIFVNDDYLWGKEDYWATPAEFLGAGAGDCEDFSIAKYFTLLELGIPQEKMRLVYVKAIELDQFHMVVAYYPSPEAVPLILDNLIPQIKPATARADLAPVYSFNGQHLWLMKEKGRGQLAGDASRLSLWNDLRERLRLNDLQQPKVRYD